jgi:hypothetical protein
VSGFADAPAGITLFGCPRCGERRGSMEALLAHMSACTAQPLRAPVVAGEQYGELRRVLDLALDQAASGKGRERHALAGQPFEEQPIVVIGEWLGSNHFELGQAVKKLRESARLKPGPAKREILGSINYAAAAYLLLEQQEAQESVLAGPQAGQG